MVFAQRFLPIDWDKLKATMKQRLLLYTLLLLAVTGPYTVCGQGTGSWERTDLFNSPNSLNVNSSYANIQVQGNAIIASTGSSIEAGWTKYSLQGQVLWQRKARGRVGGYVGPLWRDGFFSYGSTQANNRIGFAGMYYWLNGRGDTVRVRSRPALQVDQLVADAATRDGRYYLAGAGDGNGTGQTPIAQHYSLVCLDTAGNLRWQRQYLNPVIRLGPTVPIYTGANAYLMQIMAAPRRGWLLLGFAQRDSANVQPYVIEVDSAGQPRRTRWVEPFGRAASFYLFRPATALRLRDGSGYIFSGQVQLDALGRTRTNGFVAKLDTALNVVWRVLLEAPPLPPAGGIRSLSTGAVQEAADGSLRVLTFPVYPRVDNEFDIVHLSANGQLTRRDTYCSQVCNQVNPLSWQLLPGDTAIVVSGWGQQRSATGQLIAQPAWLARFDQPCRRQLITATPAGRVAGSGLVAYPQPAAPGGEVRLAGAGLARGPVQVVLVDALGRAVAVAAAVVGGEVRVQLPATLAPGLYVLRAQAAGRALPPARLLVRE